MRRVQALDRLPCAKAVRGIGLSGQMHGATLLDEADEPLRPGDPVERRAQRRRVRTSSKRRCPELHAITGNLAMPGFTAPKLALGAQARAGGFRAHPQRCCCPRIMCGCCMTRRQGDRHVGRARARCGSTCAPRRWSRDDAGRHGPRPRRTCRGCSRAREIDRRPARRVAARLGHGARAGRRPARGDNAAGAVGVGVIVRGDAFLSLGTSGVLFVATDGFRPNPARAVHAFCHCLPGRWHQMSRAS